MNECFDLMCEDALYAWLVRKTWLLQVKQWQYLLILPRRDNQGFAQTPFTREVAQATRSTFWASRQLAQARGVSPKRDPALLMPLILCPRLGGGGTRLSETVSPERDPSAWARCWARQCNVGCFSWFCMDNAGLVLSIMCEYDRVMQVVNRV